MDLALQAALVQFAHSMLGGTVEDAFAAVDELVDRLGAPTNAAELRTFMQEVEGRVAGWPVPVGG